MSLSLGNIEAIELIYNKLPSWYTDKMLVSLTVGKVDAGVAVLLTEEKRLVRSLHSSYLSLLLLALLLTCP